jgi:predicted kinase
MKVLYLIRGVSGSGKTTLAKKLVAADPENSKEFCADYFFEQGGSYKFDPTLLPAAHAWCRDAVAEALKAGILNVYVHNTFVRQWELDSYGALASIWGYAVVEITVSSTAFKNVHGVPAETIERQRKNFEF